MTLSELSQLYDLKREIEMDQRRLRELEMLVRQGNCARPEMPGGADMANKAEYYASEILDLRGIIDAKHQQCLYERNRLEPAADVHVPFYQRAVLAAGSCLHRRRKYGRRMPYGCQEVFEKKRGKSVILEKLFVLFASPVLCFDHG